MKITTQYDKLFKAFEEFVASGFYAKRKKCNGRS